MERSKKRFKSFLNEKPSLEDLRRYLRAEINQRKHESGKDFVIPSPLSIPYLIGLVTVDPRERIEMCKYAVCDEWLKGASTLPSISNRGMGILKFALRTKGWVSLTEALLFVEIEEENNRMVIQKLEERKSRNSSREGKDAILKRVDSKSNQGVKVILQATQTVAKGVEGLGIGVASIISSISRRY